VRFLTPGARRWELSAREWSIRRRIALNLTRADISLKAGLKGEREYAGWDDAFMARLIAG
jgi:hypothetical protein